MSSDDSMEWATGLFQSSVVDHDDLEEDEQEWTVVGRAGRTNHGSPSVFERELTSPLSSLSSAREEPVTRSEVTKASNRALHGRLMNWLSSIEDQEAPARMNVLSGAYNSPLTFDIARGAFASGPSLRGAPFFDLEFKREVPELFLMEKQERQAWWGDESAKESAKRMLVRLLVRGASLSKSQDTLTFEPYAEGEQPPSGETLSPLELLIEQPGQDAARDLACRVNAKCMSTALMSWTWRRTGEGVGTLGTCSEGATIDAATHALEAAYRIMESCSKDGPLGLVMMRLEQDTWSVCWTEEWLSLQLHPNAHIGRVMFAREEVDSEEAR